jgi:hypothetical protein
VGRKGGNIMEHPTACCGHDLQVLRENDLDQGEGLVTLRGHNPIVFLPSQRRVLSLEVEHPRPVLNTAPEQSICRNNPYLMKWGWGREQHKTSQLIKQNSNN